MATEDEWIFMDEAAQVAGCSKTTIYVKMKDEPGNCRKLDTTGKRGYGGFRWQVRRSWAERLEVGVNIQEVARLKARIAWLESHFGLNDESAQDECGKRMCTLPDAAAASKRSVATIRRWIRAGDLTRHEGASPAKGGSRCVMVDREELFTLLTNRNQSAQRLARVDGTTSEHKAQIEGLKTRLAAAEYDRDALVHAQISKQGEIRALQKNWGVRGKEIEGLRVRVKAVEKKRDHAITSRDKWRAESTRQKNQIEGLKARIERMESRPAPLAGAPVGELIDRLVAAVDSAPLETLTQIDKPRHAALRRVVSLWSAVDHALVMFTQPGDIAQTTNDDDEVT